MQFLHCDSNGYGGKPTGVGIELGIVDVLDNFLDGLDVAIPLLGQFIVYAVQGTHSSISDIHLKVTSDEELTTHLGGVLINLCN